MAEARDRRHASPLRLAQLLLVVAAGGLWAASRLAWVTIRSFDGLGQPKQASVTGAAWSTALLPLAVLALAAALAAIAVRGWPLRMLAVLLAAASFAAGYLAISMWASPDVITRGADIAGVAVISLQGGERHYGGALLTLASALGMLIGAALLLRAVSTGAATAGSAAPEAAAMSERMIWDALDEGRDPTQEPTDRGSGADPEGR